MVVINISLTSLYLNPPLILATIYTLSEIDV